METPPKTLSPVDHDLVGTSAQISSKWVELPMCWGVIERRWFPDRFADSDSSTLAHYGYGSFHTTHKPYHVPLSRLPSIDASAPLTFEQLYL